MINEKTEVTKSPELLTRENAELASLLRKTQQENQGFRTMLAEFGKIFSFIVQMNCGGKLTVSAETLQMLATSKTFRLDITEDAQGNRTYSTLSGKSDRVKMAQAPKLVIAPR